MGKKATLYELQTVYSLEDALYLNEILDIEQEQIYLDSQKYKK